MDLMQKRLDLGLIDPGNHNRYYMYYNIDPLNQFLSNIPKYDLPITKTETVYVESKSISQGKLREVGFKITRSKDNATFIIVDNFLKLDNSIGWSTQKSFRFNNRTKSEEFLDNRITDLDKDYKYIQTRDLYSYLYKYEGNFELYTNIMQLLKSQEVSNVTMAMEFMSNANWEDNKVYLMDIFTNYGELIWHNPYRTSISFKGFSESLSFNFRYVSLTNSDNYRPYCSKEEHHQFVYNKFDKKFKKEFKELITKFKIKVNEFNYGIDYNTEEKEC